MSTSNPLPQTQTPSLESEQRAHEPSMEEILASIRRIIADDDALPLMRRPGPSLVPREVSPLGPEQAVAPEPGADASRHPPAPPLSAPTVHLVAVPPVEPNAEIENPVEPHVTASERMEEALLAVDAHSLDRNEEEYAVRDGVAEDYELRPAMRDLPSGEEEEVASVTASQHLDRGGRPSAPMAGERGDSENTRLVSPSTDASVASSFHSLATSMFLRDSDLIARTAREMLRPMLKQWLDDNLPVTVERLVRAEIERVARGGR
jgi:cell pole-organizing protein PopZ